MHEDIINIVLNNGGAITGGYVREWVRFGEPQDKGWTDVDILCEKMDAKMKIYRELDAMGIDSDFRVTIPFNDFFCNCWLFDGKIKIVEPKDNQYSEEEIKEQTISSQAKMMRTSPVRTDKILFFRRNNWTVFTPDGSCPNDNFWETFLSVPSAALDMSNPFGRNGRFDKLGFNIKSK